jgi:hypothetical protein
MAPPLQKALLEHLAGAQDADGLDDPIIEEMARLGCRLLEAAASLTRVTAF